MFSIIKEHFFHPDIGEYDSYGIAADQEVVHDISTDFFQVEALVQTFNAEGLSPVHLREAVEDAVISHSMLL